MSKKQKLAAVTAGLVCLLFLFGWYVHKFPVPVLEPRGIVGLKERQLMFIAIGLGLLVVIPVYIMTAMIALKYREGNAKKRKYSPDWDHHRGLEFTWWAIPTAIIVFLAILTWTSSHTLDPYRPLDSSVKPLPVQVVALDWKWLFIYPEQNIASVNFMQMPVNTPVTFEITADAPMNSFWIPQLGGQIYAMPGMSTQLHLMASQAGSYAGSSANISGNGFAGMTFTAKAGTLAEFNRWVRQVKRLPASLSFAEYAKLAAPSQNNQVAYYSSAAGGLYDYTVRKYNVPASFLSRAGSQPGQLAHGGQTGAAQ